jgi:hypothetical protein
MSTQATHVCTLCATVARPKTYTKGSTIIELGLWLLLCFPGIIYSIWRLTSRYSGCPQCGAQMIGVNTPAAKRFMPPPLV